MNQNEDVVKTFTHETEAVKIAILLRALRNAFGLSQAKLAVLAKCSRPTINRIESIDKASPRSNTVNDLMNVFRERGVEIQIGNHELSFRFSENAMRNAALEITKGQNNLRPDVERESIQHDVKSQLVDSIKKSRGPDWGSFS